MVLCTVLSGYTCVTEAVQVTDLYQARVTTLSQTEAARVRAVRAALRVVIVKLIGARHLIDQGAMNRLLNKADTYVLRYIWSSLPRESYSTPQKFSLEVFFNEKLLNEDLYQQGFAIWGKERPSTLVWLLIKDVEGERILDTEMDKSYLQVLNGGARDRGMKLLYPLMDLEDEGALSIEDVRQLNTARITAASSRYSADLVLSGALEEVTPGLWRSRWQLLMGEDILQWQSDAESFSLVLEESVSQFVNNVAERYAGGRVTGRDILNLQVNGVQSFSDYATVAKYVSQLNSVISWRETGFEGDRVYFELTSAGGVAMLLQAIELNRVLTEVPGTAGLEFNYNRGVLR